MTLAEFVKSYHACKVCPVFVFPSSDELFRSNVDGYSTEGTPALERFAQANGFRLVRQDFGARLKFVPWCEPEDYDGWTEEVAFDRTTLKPQAGTSATLGGSPPSSDTDQSS